MTNSLRKTAWLLLFLLLPLQSIAFDKAVMDRLAALPGISKVEPLESEAYQDKHVMFIKQQVAHDDASVGTFDQRLIVCHVGFDRPTILVTEGYYAHYALRKGYQEELSKILNANVITVEYRYFAESVPQPCNWDYLTVENSLYDLHNVNMTFRQAYKGKWIASGISKGVVMVSQRRSMFGYIGSRTTQKNIIGSHCILSLCRGKDGGLWVGTDGDGLYRLYGSSSQHLVQGVPPIINSVIEDSDGRTWIGSFGYPCYSGTGGVFTPVPGLPEQANVFAIREDRNRRIWLGTMGYGVYCYDMQKKSLSWVSSPVINKYVNCLYVLSNGHVLAGTFNGIYNITTPRHTMRLSSCALSMPAPLVSSPPPPAAR